MLDIDALVAEGNKRGLTRAELSDLISDAIRAVEVPRVPAQRAAFEDPHAVIDRIERNALAVFGYEADEPGAYLVGLLRAAADGENPEPYLRLFLASYIAREGA
jgi:hypothetical protein